VSRFSRLRPRRAARRRPPGGLVRIGIPALALGLAGVTAVAATLGPDRVTAEPAAAPVVAAVSSASSESAARDERARRSAPRPELIVDVARGAPAARVQDAFGVDLSVVGRRYATVALSLRRAPKADAKVAGVAKAGARLAITRTTEDGWRLVVRSDEGFWVKERQLSKSKTAADGISNAPCRAGSSVEVGGLTSDGIRVHRAVCARFPQVNAYGARGSGYHASGRAIDIMIADSAVGWQIATWVRANAKRLGVSEVIYSQRIWTVQRGGEGWRGMSDRGSATANHYDHVHVSVYGSSGTG
jgi:hypothetical protein